MKKCQKMIKVPIQARLTDSDVNKVGLTPPMHNRKNATDLHKLIKRP
jgi:hypothetical protein